MGTHNPVDWDPLLEQDERWQGGDLRARESEVGKSASGVNTRRLPSCSRERDV